MKANFNYRNIGINNIRTSTPGTFSANRTQNSTNNSYVKNECYLVSTSIYLYNTIKHNNFTISPEDEALIDQYIQFVVPLEGSSPNTILNTPRMRRLATYYLVKKIYDIAMLGKPRAFTLQYVKALQTLVGLAHREQGDIYSATEKLKKLLGADNFKPSSSSNVYADVLNSDALKKDLHAIIAGDKGVCYDASALSGYKIVDRGNSDLRRVNYICAYYGNHFYDIIRGKDGQWFKIDTSCPYESSLKAPINIDSLLGDKVRIVRIVAEESTCGRPYNEQYLNSLRFGRNANTNSPSRFAPSANTNSPNNSPNNSPGILRSAYNEVADLANDMKNTFTSVFSDTRTNIPKATIPAKISSSQPDRKAPKKDIVNNSYVNNECYLVSASIYLYNIIKHDNFTISPEDEALIDKYVQFVIPLEGNSQNTILNTPRMRRLATYYLVKKIYDIAILGKPRAFTLQYVKALQTLIGLEHRKQGDIYSATEKLKKLLGADNVQSSSSDIVHADVLNSDALKKDLRAIIAGSKGICYDDSTLSGYKIVDRWDSKFRRVDYLCAYYGSHFYDIVRGKDGKWFQIDTSCPYAYSLKKPLNIDALLEDWIRIVRITTGKSSYRTPYNEPYLNSLRYGQYC